MDPLDIVQSFIESCEQAEKLDDLHRSFESAIARLGYRYFACGSHVDPLKPNNAVMLLNYPRAWVEAYSELQLHKIDPVFAKAESSGVPFFWDEPAFLGTATAEQRRMMSEARAFGIEHGYTIPVHSPRSPIPIHASCSVIPERGRPHRHGHLAVQLMAGYLFESAARLTSAPPDGAKPPKLSPRQRQCLELAAQGKTDWEIGMILGISEHTVHTHIEAVKRKLNVTSRQTAIVCSLAWGLIDYGNALRVKMPRHSSSSSASKAHSHPH